MGMIHLLIGEVGKPHALPFYFVKQLEIEPMDFEEEIKALAKKAKDGHDSADALRFSQAALNLANTLSVFHHTNKEQGKS